jgi:polyphosphate kinase
MTRFPPESFTNRELSWLDFNARVLEEARDQSNPVLERVKFLAITASNLDEFFEVRVAGVVQAAAEDVDMVGPDGVGSRDLLSRICRRCRDFVADQYQIWNDELKPALTSAGVVVGASEALWARHEAELWRYVEERLRPVLTPLAIDPAHPFPRVENKLLCIAGLIRKPGIGSTTRLAVVTIPRVLPRLVPVKDSDPPAWLFLGELVIHFFDRLFPGYEVSGVSEFRVTRNSNLYVNEEEADNLLEAISDELRQRRRGDAVRLEISDSAPRELESMLTSALDLSDELVFRVKGPVNLHRLMSFYGSLQRADLKFGAFQPVEPAWAAEGAQFFDRLRDQDLLLHHPFDSFNPVAGFVQAGANDPKVLAIKVTLYRTGDDSPVVNALIAAAKAGKQVTAVVELKARFDEAKNIQWARTMEEAGVQVVFGLVGLKTHCKLCVLVRDEGNQLRRYAHLGTGNYNPTTAKVYTDLSLLTAREDITADVSEVFNLLTTLSSPQKFHKLSVSPAGMLSDILKWIDLEAREARAGRPARIIAKCNALVDRDVITALYEASQAGVTIDLIVRGICCLRPGVPGLSDHIQVRSVVGRYLEHSRIYWFHAAGDPRLVVGSADLMPRNLRGRVEVLFPIEDRELARYVRDEILAVYLEPRPRVRILGPDGTYSRVPSEQWVDDRDPHAVFLQRVQKQLAQHQRVVEREPPRPARPRARRKGAFQQASAPRPPQGDVA